MGGVFRSFLPILKEEDWNGLLEAWLETPDTISPLTERIDIAHQSAMQRISDERSQSDRAQKEQAKARIEIIDQLDALRAGRQPELRNQPHHRWRAHQACVTSPVLSGRLVRVQRAVCVWADRQGASPTFCGREFPRHNSQLAQLPSNCAPVSARTSSSASHNHR